MTYIGFRNLCSPAYVYLIISVFALIVMLAQNLGSGNVNTYCLGDYSCSTSSLSLLFVAKLIYVLFWTWVLNLICRAGVPALSWFLVLFPFILMFILIAIMMMS